MCVCSGPCLFTFYCCGILSILELFNFLPPYQYLNSLLSLDLTQLYHRVCQLLKGSVFLHLWSPHRTWKIFTTSSTGRAWSSSKTALDLAEKDSLVSSRSQEVTVWHGFLKNTVCLSMSISRHTLHAFINIFQTMETS